MIRPPFLASSLVLMLLPGGMLLGVFGQLVDFGVIWRMVAPSITLNFTQAYRA